MDRDGLTREPYVRWIRFAVPNVIPTLRRAFRLLGALTAKPKSSNPKEAA